MNAPPKDSEDAADVLPSNPPSLSIIIPAINEADALPATLAAIGCPSDIEILLADGGSTDGTPDLAAAHGVRVVHSAPGRANQMNAGAAAARSETLLFLHADTQLPTHYAEHVETTLAAPNVVAGAFRLAFDDSRTSLRLIAAGANRRSVHRQLPYGDQALFLRRATFIQLGGFRPLPIMEDYDLVRRLRRRGQIAIAPTPVTTAARRWLERGVWRTTLTHQLLLLGWNLGIPPHRLARWRSGRTNKPRRMNRLADRGRKSY